MMLMMNVSKTKWMLKTSLKVYINNVKVPNSVCEKLLGVLIQNNFDWTSHVKKVTSTVKSNLYLLKRIRPFLTQNARKIFCNSYVHPHLDYLCTVWGNTTQENLRKLF